jgi:serine/threonine protein kinase
MESRQLVKGDVWEKYEKLTHLGSGSYASVWKAKSKTNGREVAVKVIQKQTGNNPGEDKDLKRLQIESSIMLTVDHPHVIKCYEIFEDSSSLSFVLAFVETGDLFDHISKVGHFSEVTASGLVNQILSGLEYLHSKGISHRDLKVENILCCSKHGDMFVEIADFGLSIQSVEALITQVGSLEYAAPEIFSGKPYSYKCDIWSLGVITFILLTGHFPFHSKSPRQTYQLIQAGRFSWGEYEDKLTAEAKSFVSTLLQVDPAVRPSASEAMKHPWISKKNDLPKHAHLHRQDTLDKLKNFKKTQS